MTVGAGQTRLNFAQLPTFVTIDAMGCQKDIVSAIAAKEADLATYLRMGNENYLAKMPHS